MCEALFGLEALCPPKGLAKRSHEILCFGNTLLWPTAFLSQWHYFSQRPLLGSPVEEDGFNGPRLTSGRCGFLVKTVSRNWGLTQLCDLTLTVPPMKLRHWQEGGKQDPCSHKQGVFWFYRHVNTMREKCQQPCKNKVTACFDHSSPLSKAGP